MEKATATSLQRPTRRMLEGLAPYANPLNSPATQSLRWVQAVYYLRNKKFGETCSYLYK
jgi:hypothetical protein